MTIDTKVTVIGLGLMGSALAKALSKSGLSVTVWNRSIEKANSFNTETVNVAGSLVAAIKASEIVVVCIRDYEATDKLFRVNAVEAELDGKVILQLSTGTPAKAREAAAWIISKGGSYLDGEIMGFPDAVGTNECTILYSGDVEAFISCKRVIDAFGGTVQHIGEDPGFAAALSSAVLSIYFSFLFGALNGAAICDAENVPLSLFKDLGISLLPVFGDVLSRSVDMISSDAYESQHSTLETSVGALNQIASVGEGAHLDGRFVECMRKYAMEGLEAGHGSVGNAVIFKQFSRD